MGGRKVVWVTGAKGFVGRAVCAHFRASNYNVVATDEEVSVCNLEALRDFARHVRPSIIINCAGIRRDKADLEHRIEAYAVNALGAKNLAMVAASQHALLVQISSDDVFSSLGYQTVDEFDTPYPDTPYGKSKRAGETMVRALTEDHIIVRSSWLYSAQERALYDILNAAKCGSVVTARTDQIAAPLSLATFATLLEDVIKAEGRGVFHLASSGCASRYDFAALALRCAGYDPYEVLIEATHAASAQHLVLVSSRLGSMGLSMPSWDEDLERTMGRLGLLTTGKKTTFQNNDKVACNS